MSGRARLALCAWAATIMAACALLPLVDPATWIIQAALMLGVQTGVGALTRRVPLARPLTVAAQALVTLMMLTLVFARERAVAGIVPGPRPSSTSRRCCRTAPRTSDGTPSRRR